MSFGTERLDRPARRLLIAMIVIGAALTALSFAIQANPGAVKTKLNGLVDAVAPIGKMNALG